MNTRKKIAECIELARNGSYQLALERGLKIYKKNKEDPFVLDFLGRLYFFIKNFKSSLFFLDKLSKIKLSEPNLLNDLGVCYFELKSYEKALECFDKAIKVNSNFVNPLFNKALIFEAQEKFQEAISLHKKIIQLDSQNADSLRKLSNIFIRISDFNSAYESLNTLCNLKKFTDDPILFQEKSFCLVNIGNLEDALVNINKSIQLNPFLSESYNNKGNILKDLKKYKEALENFNKAIEINPLSSDAYNNRGNLFQEMNEYKKSLADFDHAINIDPKNVNFYQNRAILNRINKYFDAALEDINFVISINASAKAFKLRSDINTDKGDYEKAIEDLTIAISLEPNKYSYLNDRGLLFQGLGNYEAAIQDYKTLPLPSGELDSEQKFNLAICHLHQMQFDLAWEYYKSRKNMDKFSTSYPKTSKPMWRLGNSGRVYVSNEQGIGDQILFASLICELKKNTTQIILSVDPKLDLLFKRSFSDIEIYPVNLIEKDNPKFIPKFLDESNYDFHLAIGDLPLLFRKNLNDFNLQKSSYLKADKKRSESYRNKFLKNKRFICGIAWKSKALTGSLKSFSLNELMPIFNLKDIEFLNLQYGEVKDEISELKFNHGVNINVVEELDIYNDVAGLSDLIDACDFIITSSNVTAHLAGALGKNVFVLAPYGNGFIWYWKDYYGRNLWYPKLKVIKSPNANNWSSSIAELFSVVKENVYG